jgi:hypothetical protein
MECTTWPAVNFSKVLAKEHWDIDSPRGLRCRVPGGRHGCPSAEPRAERIEVRCSAGRRHAQHQERGPSLGSPGRQGRCSNYIIVYIVC